MALYSSALVIKLLTVAESCFKPILLLWPKSSLLLMHYYAFSQSPFLAEALHLSDSTSVASTMSS